MPLLKALTHHNPQHRGLSPIALVGATESAFPKGVNCSATHPIYHMSIKDL